MALIKVIPDGVVVPLNKIYSNKGRCNWKMCQKDYASLRRHFEKVHVKGGVFKRHNTLKVIPATGNVDPDKLTYYQGFCKRPGCNRKYGQLRRHFVDVHRDGERLKRPPSIKHLKDGNEIDVDLVVARSGKCELDDCDKTVAHLRRHYIDVHLKTRKQCSICQKFYGVSSIRVHMLVHSGPAKCKICNKPGVSVAAILSHMQIAHGSRCKVEVELVLGEELSGIEEDKRKKIENKMKTSIMHPLEKHKDLLDAYEFRLKDPSHPFFKKAQDLKSEFDKRFRVPPNSLIIVNSNFISVWSVKMMIPLMIFYKVRNKRRRIKYSGSTFYPDPKLATPSQPNTNDYKNSGFDRGHGAPAADFEEELEVAATYYFSNISPMYPVFNRYVNFEFECDLRDLGMEYDGVWAAHFPIIKGTRMKTSSGITVPPGFGKIVFIEEDGVVEIRAWELFNIPYYYDYRQCARDDYLALLANTDFTLNV